jgi:hypothetical protein
MIVFALLRELGDMILDCFVLRSYTLTGQVKIRLYFLMNNQIISYVIVISVDYVEDLLKWCCL